MSVSSEQLFQDIKSANATRFGVFPEIDRSSELIRDQIEVYASQFGVESETTYGLLFQVALKLRHYIDSLRAYRPDVDSAQFEADSILIAGLVDFLAKPRS